MRRVALVCIGLVLLAAGVAKIAALSGPVDTLGWPREMIVAGSAVELLLGGWLLSGAAIRLAHLAAIGVFLLFAVLSAYQVVRGVPSCGCLGKLYVHPAWMLGFDLLTLGLLGSLWFVAKRSPANPTASGGREPSVSSSALSERRYALVAGSVACMALAAVAFAGFAFAGSFDGALGVAGGREVVVSPSTVDLGSGTVGETKRATVRIVNASASPIRIVGGKNSCGCMVTGELPIAVPVRASVEFPIEVTIRGEGYKEVVFTLFTDHAEQPLLAGRVRMNGKAATPNEVALAAEK
ncbi:MAG TPA: MauE/DoxX family redox-associated membrane protein [Pirellulaceae bacterium]|jgi:hypothetical protein|nr:MauE/DoxX family redox-associated membrane protein [Pirellulaceae bacterium]